MPTILITAFEPYDRWPENASWLAMVELTRDLPLGSKVVTRRYPVDFELVRDRLREDLATNYDLALHLGQAPGISRVHLECIGINVGGHSSQAPDQCEPLVPGGPAAYQSSLPLADWAAAIRTIGVPCQVSYHAGTFLCNALLYLSQHFCALERLKTRATFIHVPLAPEQVLNDHEAWPTLTSSQCAAAIRCILHLYSGSAVA